MIYTLHGDGNYLYEVVDTEMEKPDLIYHWKKFYNDINEASEFQTYIERNKLPIKIIQTEFIPAVPQGQQLRTG